LRCELHIEYGRSPGNVPTRDSARFGRLYRDEPGSGFEKQGPSRLYWPLRQQANVEQYR